MTGGTDRARQRGEGRLRRPSLGPAAGARGYGYAGDTGDLALLLTTGWMPAPSSRMWCGGEALPVDLGQSAVGERQRVADP